MDNINEASRSQRKKHYANLVSINLGSSRVFEEQEEEDEEVAVMVADPKR